MLPSRVGARLSAFALLMSVGCRSAATTDPVSLHGANIHPAAMAENPSRAEPSATKGSRDAGPALVSFDDSTPLDDRSLNADELSLDALVAEVQTRNPSVQSMVAAWQAAAQRYPQVIALDDPMFQTVVAPASIGSSTTEPAYAFQGSQKFPWYGKRALRGQVAKADADAAYFDVEDSRVRLAEATRLAFFDYYLARRDLDLNAENIRVMQEFRDSAVSRYENQQVTEQDLLQAKVELADLDRRRIEFERMHRVSIARINTLLRRPVNSALPPPSRLKGPVSLPTGEVLEQVALEKRPDLAAIRQRVESEQAAVQLACKQFYPDVEVFGRYDTFWQPESTQHDLRGQVGINVNVPIYRRKLNAAVNEATFRLSQRRAEYAQRELDIQYEVKSAYEQAEESRKTAHLYSERLIPAAVENVNAARINYVAGKMTFLGLAQAQRQLIELREKQQEAIANSHRRLAELERVVGGSIPTTIEPRIIAAPPERGPEPLQP